MNKRSLRVLEFNKIIELLKLEITSNVGKNIAENLVPSSNIEVVRESLKETSEALSLIIRKGNFPSGPIFDLKKYLKLAQIGSSLNTKQLIETSDTLRTSRRIKSFIEGNDSEIYPKLFSYSNSITMLKGVEDEINNAIIGEDIISDKASSKLKNIRKSIENKNTSIRQKLDSIVKSSSNQKYLQDAIVTIRQGRFVVPVKSEYRSMIKGIIHDQSSTGSTLYIEPYAIVDFNNELSQLKIDEKEEIERILMELSALVGQSANEIRLNIEMVSIIDFIIGKGKLSLKYNGVEPILNERGYVNIKSARHPLINKKDIVANNIYIGENFNILLITGPNTGGKTVTIKTLGLLSLMNQAGLHIPANHNSQMSIFTNVFADIGDEQSIEQSLSTFSSHMTNIVEIIRDVDAKSLVLFDELGAGTDPTEGAALAMSILSFLHKKNITAVATTHYSELKEFALLTDRVENASVEFNVETLSPTYKLLIGVPGKSNAFEISKKLGLREDIIEESKIFIKRENIEFEKILETIEENRKEAQKEKDEAVRMRIEIENLKKQVNEKKEKLSSQKDRILRDAKSEARKLLKDSKEESERIIKELRGLSESNDKEKNRKIEEARRKLKRKLENTEENIFEKTIDYKKIPKNLKIGDTVKLINLDQIGNALTKPDSDGNLTVQVGIMKIKTNKKDLLLIKEKKEHSSSKKISKSYTINSANISPELDLRGYNVEEAILELDKYLDDVYLSSVKSVTIIHGKGTGALKSGLKSFFQKHSHIKSFREGVYGEGGSGVTVLEIK
ncbi:endonuclease MutS2 [Helicovermis profundi]|uniref:Endonuclease MutS2 n=1 Tax=Helicovermis profundi TaxID=3065157 RepID=A0AAU9E5K4_9FIRM|nr:endonuclease MutS2 [Clostridia bacterium S502]